MLNFYPEDFGAAGDGIANDGKAIQAAIDECSKKGGGTVVLTGGRKYYSESIEMRANVCLYLQKGSILQATDNINQYIRPCDTINDPKTALIGNPVTGKPSFAFIYGYEADYCSIEGEGTIDANGHSFVHRKDKYYCTGHFYPRPTVIYIEKSHHISIKDVTIRNAAFWTLHPAGCNDVLISQIRILNDLDVANADGIDPDHCTNVRILGCHIECADDCICLKTSKGNAEYGPCENVLISDCTLISTSAAIKIGTEGVGDFRNILVRGCIISHSNRGLSIQIRDGGHVENVSYSDCIIETRRFSPDWWGTAEPIVITAFDRDENTTCGKIRNIRFSNITCKGENGVLIHGTEKSRIEDISFDRVSVTLDKTSKWECGLYDLRPCLSYAIEKEKNSAFFLRHAERVVLNDCRFSLGSLCEDYLTGVDAADCPELAIQNLKGSAAKEGVEAVYLHN